MSSLIYPKYQQRMINFFLLALLTLFLITASGCASAPLHHRAYLDLAQRKGGIRTVGLLPPEISMFEEVSGGRLVPRAEWSLAAVKKLSTIFTEVITSDRIQVVPISTDDLEMKDLADLYNAVEFSIQRHAWEKESGRTPPREPFPEKVRTFDYSLGPAMELMERFKVDAVWIVRGFNVLPTTGATLTETTSVILGLLAALGRKPFPVISVKKIEISVALVDRTGRVLYYGVADDLTIRSTGQSSDKTSSEGGYATPVSMKQQTYVTIDLRDERVARYYLTTALSEYRMVITP